MVAGAAGRWTQKDFPLGQLIAVYRLACITLPSVHPSPISSPAPGRSPGIRRRPKRTTSTTAPGACLTLEKWNQLGTENDPVPAGLGGKILTTVNEGGPLPAIYVSNLDGTNARKIATGAWPSLSPDGTRLAYSTADGLHVLDLSTGQSSSLGMDGHNLIWSPDGTRILYTTTFNLYVINADGSGNQKIDTGSAQVISSVGWLPDNQTIVYGAMGGEGFTFTTYNLQSGETKKLFSFQNKAGYGAISADGQWIVFSDKVFGAQNWGIFISRLDGTERKLVADPGVPTAFTSIWGPGGQMARSSIHRLPRVPRCRCWSIHSPARPCDCKTSMPWSRAGVHELDGSGY